VFGTPGDVFRRVATGLGTAAENDLISAPQSATWVAEAVAGLTDHEIDEIGAVEDEVPVAMIGAVRAEVVHRIVLGAVRDDSPLWRVGDRFPAGAGDGAPGVRRRDGPKRSPAGDGRPRWLAGAEWFGLPLDTKMVGKVIDELDVHDLLLGVGRVGMFSPALALRLLEEPRSRRQIVRARRTLPHSLLGVNGLLTEPVAAIVDAGLASRRELYGRIVEIALGDKISDPRALHAFCQPIRSSMDADLLQVLIEATDRHSEAWRALSIYMPRDSRAGRPADPVPADRSASARTWPASSADDEPDLRIPTGPLVLAAVVVALFVVSFLLYAHSEGEP